ncbi:MAG TPA: hypothetical protein VLA56_20085 [Pseudomonadales bacterium]|nr:hypothetical protein [Pseudomonadales bacterium]
MDVQIPAAGFPLVSARSARCITRVRTSATPLMARMDGVGEVAAADGAHAGSGAAIA